MRRSTGILPRAENGLPTPPLPCSNLQKLAVSMAGVTSRVGGERNIRRRAAHHDIEGPRNYRPMHIEAEQHQVLRRQRETDGFAFTGAEGNPLEPVQLFDSGRDRGKALMGIQLNRFYP